MTAYEKIDGQYYEQGSDEYYAALEAATAKAYPVVPPQVVEPPLIVKRVVEGFFARLGLRA